MRLFRCGCGERVKCGVHASLGLLALLCTAYNAAAFGLRRERHLAVNVLLYGSVTCYEWRMVRHHWAGHTSDKVAQAQ